MVGKSFCKRFLSALIFGWLGILINNNCDSQTIVNSQNPNEKIFLVRTKQFNEFIDRFNYKTNLNGNPVDSVFKSKMTREKIINSLFDLKDFRADLSGKNWSKNYTDLKTEFINEVLYKNILIFKYFTLPNKEIFGNTIYYVYINKY